MHSRVATAALNACEAFLVRAAGKNDLLIKTYTSFEPLFKQTDLDAEAKEAAIRAAARAICNLGTSLPSVNAALDVLVERLGSELTREAAASAVATIATSAVKATKIDLLLLLLFFSLFSKKEKNQGSRCVFGQSCSAVVLSLRTRLSFCEDCRTRSFGCCV